MNTARIAVGIQGLSQLATAYQNALEYAKDRKQGSNFKQWKDASAPRVSIIEHPDVRRMLLELKATSEGIRALISKLASHADRVHLVAGTDDEAAAYHKGQVDLLDAAGEVLRQRRGLPALRGGAAGVRRRRLHPRLPGRAVPARLEDLLHLRGHQPHPGHGPRGSQARPGWRREPPGLHGRRGRLHREAQGAPGAGQGRGASGRGAGGRAHRRDDHAGLEPGWTGAAGAAGGQPLPHHDVPVRGGLAPARRGRSSPSRPARACRRPTRIAPSTWASATARSGTRATCCRR